MRSFSVSLHFIRNIISFREQNWYPWWILPLRAFSICLALLYSTYIYIYIYIYIYKRHNKRYICFVCLFGKKVPPVKRSYKIFTWADEIKSWPLKKVTWCSCFTCHLFHKFAMPNFIDFMIDACSKMNTSYNNHAIEDRNHQEQIPFSRSRLFGFLNM